MKRIVILGGGTGGTLVANRLRHLLPRTDAAITVVDQDDDHIYQPGLLFVPFGLTKPEHLIRSRQRQIHRGIECVESGIDRVDIVTKQVHLLNGRVLDYDVLIVATGATLLPEETEGLLGPGWNSDVFTFYNFEGATALGAALRQFNGGRLVVNVVDMPIKCPVAPLEFCFLADAYFEKRGIRKDVSITYVTPLDAAFTKPIAAQHLRTMLSDKGIELVTEFNTGSVDEEAHTLTSFDGRTIGYDLAVVIPVHGGAAYVQASPGLGDALNFITVDTHTLQSTVSPDTFAIGDAAGIPASKAGSVTHFEGEVVASNVLRRLRGQEPVAQFDGHANCFIETGHRRALLIDFNYDTEPLPGHFPRRLGLPLLKESRLNHIGKRLFEWVYWHGLLAAKPMPGIGPAMPRQGKRGLTARDHSPQGASHAN